MSLVMAPLMADPTHRLLNWVGKPNLAHDQPDWTIDELAAESGWALEVVAERIATFCEWAVVLESRQRVCGVTKRRMQAYVAA